VNGSVKKKELGETDENEVVSTVFSGGDDIFSHRDDPLHQKVRDQMILGPNTKEPLGPLAGPPPIPAKQENKK
jgi:hypothetical protein